MMRPLQRVLAALVILAAACAAHAQTASAPASAPADWPRWRGPTSSGAIIGGPALASKFPAEGPPKLWETFLAGAGESYSSPAAADGRVYMLITAWQHVVTPDALKALADLGIPAEALDDLKTNGLYFHGEDQWMPKYKIPQEKRKAIMDLLKTTHSIDRVVCLDANTGHIIWKNDYDLERAYVRGTASTPCIWNGRVYGALSKHEIYCVDAKTGQEIWTSENCAAGHASVLVAEGVAVVCGAAKNICALDALTGKELWHGPDINGDYSPALWKHDGKTYVISCRGNGPVVLRCHEITTGQILWTCPATAQTVAVEGDYMAALDHNAKSANPKHFMPGRLAVYKISSAKPEKICDVDLADAASCPILAHGYVYYTACSRAVCIEAKTGTVKWNEPIEAGRDGTGAAGRIWSSPLLADGKLFAILDNAKNAHQDGTGTEPLGVFDANPEHFQLLGTIDTQLWGCTSPAILGTKLFVHTTHGIACFDLSPNALRQP